MQPLDRTSLHTGKTCLKPDTTTIRNNPSTYWTTGLRPCKTTNLYLKEICLKPDTSWAHWLEIRHSPCTSWEHSLEIRHSPCTSLEYWLENRPNACTSWEHWLEIRHSPCTSWEHRLKTRQQFMYIYKKFTRNQTICVHPEKFALKQDGNLYSCLQTLSDIR